MDVSSGQNTRLDVERGDDDSLSHPYSPSYIKYRCYPSVSVPIFFFYLPFGATGAASKLIAILDTV